MGLKNEQARARRRMKQKELLSCVSIKSNEDVKKSYRPPKLALDNNFGWKIIEKTQVGDGSFPHLTGFYEKPDLDGQDFQKVTYVLYMDKGAVVKKDCIVEQEEPVSRGSVYTQPSSVRVVEEPSEIIKPPRQEPKPKRQKKLIKDFYYRGLKSRSPSMSRSQSPVSEVSGKKRDKSKRRIMDKPDGDTSDERGQNKSSRKLMDNLRNKSEGADSDKSGMRKPTGKMIGKLKSKDQSRSMESLDSKPSNLQRVISVDRDLDNAAREARVEFQDEQEKWQKEVNDKKRDMEFRPRKKDKVPLTKEEKQQKAVNKAREQIDRRNKKFKSWGLRKEYEDENLRAGASSVSVGGNVQPDKSTQDLGRRRDKSTISLQRALPDRFKKPSESLLDTPSGSNKYLYVPVPPRK